MTSESDLFVWMYLPGSIEPVVCGRFVHRPTPGGQDLGTFVYGKTYLSRRQAVPIDPVALPLREHPFETPYFGGWFPALLDSGPDEWGKRVIDRVRGPQSMAGYLLHSRGESIGALAFSRSPDEPPERHADPPGIGTLARLVDIHRLIESGEPVAEADRHLLLQGTSAGGARPKTTIEDDGRLWLAKFPSTRDSPDQPANPSMEAALLDVAAECGIRVPAHRVVDVGGTPVLLVERFDRTALANGRFTRWRYASARTLLWSRPEVQKYSFMGSYMNLVASMRTWERAPSQDIRELFRRISFNCLVGNTDDHDCNTGFVAGNDGFFRLSPAFDLSARPATQRMYLAMGFGVDGATVSLENLVSESEQFGHGHAEAATLAASQWQTISEKLVARLVAHGVGEDQAISAWRAMPGQTFF